MDRRKDWGWLEAYCLYPNDTDVFAAVVAVIKAAEKCTLTTTERAENADLAKAVADLKELKPDD